MTDRLRTDLVFGGLWERARVDCAPLLNCLWWKPGHILWKGEVLPAEEHECWLHLDDPLGLGLAGLAARVAARCGHLGRVELPDYLPKFDLSAWWYDWKDVDAAGLVATSTYLALTDRLCAAVGLGLGDGEVARWSSFVYDGEARWSLRCRASEAHFMGRKSLVGRNVPALADLGPDDWQEALEACLAEVARG